MERVAEKQQPASFWHELVVTNDIEVATMVVTNDIEAPTALNI